MYFNTHRHKVAEVVEQFGTGISVDEFYFACMVLGPSIGPGEVPGEVL